MSEITLEKIDLVRERTGASYADAKQALETCEGNVVDAIIYMEKNKKSTLDNIYSSKDEFLTWIKELINKGNITKIRVKKDDKVLVDMPVNAGIAVGIVAYAIWAPLIAIGVIGAVVTNITVELTKKDGSVEVINKVIKSTVHDVKEKVSDVVSEAKTKVSDVASDVKEKFNVKKDDEQEKGNETVYTYTVKFDDIDNNDTK
ncbi:DUF4342 domain-containing protein [Clostridium swellfunianum]|uniref:DUF4342 domain-containing protein n=1 Tax=Clostridium swellfunianum TaxID=1367462 RepID=UPI0020300B58|nr:DUF4342 domain-containing protein [Clostridium swellfunianum]MCM0648817.1 DUF4342 domain-containing protein [Clostridium swellfunianum]